MSEFQLRDYQSEAVEKLRAGIREGHRAQILSAATGSGKTVIAAFLMAEADRKMSRTAFVVDRIALVDQTSRLLDEYGVQHGIIQAGNVRWRPYERIQVCSAQTLEKRGYLEQCALLIVDEAHCIRKQTAEIIKKFENLKVIGLTATPFTKGLGELYSNVVHVANTDDLVAQGFLAPMVMYAAKAIDMKGAKVVAGEWSDKEIEERGKRIVGDVVGEWIAKTDQHFGGPVKTIVFSATVAHGEDLCRRFQEAGHNFQQISYKDANDEKRRALIEEFRTPDSEVMGLISCEILAKGFDVPDVMCGVSCRPYRKSFSSHIQQLGRVMRTHPAKKEALWLCHSGNLIGFYDEMREFFANGVKVLKDGEHDATVRKELGQQEKDAIVCSCGFVLPKGSPRCPACGKERRSKRTSVEEIDGQLVQLNGSAVKALPDFLCDKAAVWRQICYHALERKKGDMEAAQRFAQAQYRNFYGQFARAQIRETELEPPHPKLVGKITQNIIRYARRRAA